MGTRKFVRKVVKSRMQASGCTQISKTHYKSVDREGNATTIKRPSFFSMSWREKHN